MLVLQRKLYESIVIGGNVRVEVVRISGEYVRLAIAAPPDVQVDRLEVHEARQRGDLRPNGKPVQRS